MPGCGTDRSCWGCVLIAMDVELDLTLSMGSCIWHDDTRDEAGSLAVMALTKSKVSYKPTIYYDRGVTVSQPTNTRQTGSNVAGDEARGDVNIHGLWEKGSECILDISITDTGAKPYQNIASSKVLERAAKLKKDKYLTACLERCCTFMPLVYLVDGMACKEALAFKKRVASLLASKWNRPYIEMVGFVCSSMSLAIICSNNTMLLCGAQAGRAWKPVIKDSAGVKALRRTAEW